MYYLKRERESEREREEGGREGEGESEREREEFRKNNSDHYSFLQITGRRYAGKDLCGGRPRAKIRAARHAAGRRHADKDLCGGRPRHAAGSANWGERGRRDSRSAPTLKEHGSTLIYSDFRLYKNTYKYNVHICVRRK